jgi:hypothetical protein
VGPGVVEHANQCRLVAHAFGPTKTKTLTYFNTCDWAFLPFGAGNPHFAGRK